MNNRTLLKTNLLVCTIIALGFAITSVISYRSNFGVYQKDVEQVSTLSSDGLYNEITSVFSQPVSVSLTMANDSLLKSFLEQENSGVNDVAWMDDMQDYLNAYRLKYNYDSVFLVSTASNNYFHFEGLNRNLVHGDSENEWYYNFLENEDEYSMNIDNDQVKNNHITAFVNCKIKDTTGNIIGVVGVGVKVDSLQGLLSTYEAKYGIDVYLIDEIGIIEISSSVTGYEQTNLFDKVKFSQEKFWYSLKRDNGYVVTRYEPNLKWHLVVEYITTQTNQYFNNKLIQNIIIIIFIILIVLIIITTVIRRYNNKISNLTSSQELEYQHMMHEMTEGLYEHIFEFDFTKNRASGNSTKKYFRSLGIAEDETIDNALQIIANKQVKEEYIKGYIETFQTSSVLQAFHNGITNLFYSMMITDDGKSYHWMRISARIFYWGSDESIRMITYRQNIDIEKKRELMLLEGIQKDSMTGLYNKQSTESQIANILCEKENDAKHTLLMIDIDNFKMVNDTMGHSFGDQVINEIAREIQAHFRENDIVGRVGGDEFVVLMKNFDQIDILNKKMTRLCRRIENKKLANDSAIQVTCSIGSAFYPQDGNDLPDLYDKADQALYYAKNHGKNSFVLYREINEQQNGTFRINQRDLESIMNIATDGLAQYALTQPLTLLYFNQKLVELTGISSKELSNVSFDPFAPIHPEDLDKMTRLIERISMDKRPFAISFRMLHTSGEYYRVSTKGFFVDQMYQNKYPIFYIIYVKENKTK